MRSFQDILPEVPSTVGIELDWHAYFVNFSSQHGGDPVEHGGRLLFRDAWQYSATDYAGPEYPPLESEQYRGELVRTYWTLRKDIVSEELYQLEYRVRGLRDLQSNKSLPIHQVFAPYWDEDKRVMVDETIDPVDWNILESRLRWLRDDVDLCCQELERLKEANNVQT